MKAIPIEGFETYFVTEEGRVWSNKRNKYIAIFYPDLNSKRSGIVSMYLNGWKYQHSIHLLVAKHFIPNPNKYKYVRHIDGKIQNNHVNNLCWDWYQ